MKPPIHLDLFSGVGGFSLGLKRAGFKTVAFSEIEPFSCKALSHHWPGVPNLGDITKISKEQIEALGHIDIVTFGSPCQDWSIAGKRLGLKGHRSSLFHEAIRVIRAIRGGPGFAVFENVPGLFSSASGWDFAAVLDELADAGAMDIAWSVLDAQWFGVPQRRRRIFVVADFGGERAGKILSITQGVCRDSPPSGEAREGTAPLLEVGARTNGDGYRDGDGIGKPGDPMYTLQAGKQHGIVPEVADGTDHPLAAGAHPAAVADQTVVRRLTPLECERLQGFPDGWTDIPGASNSARYRVMGNAVAVPVVEWIAHRLRKEMQ